MSLKYVLFVPLALLCVPLGACSAGSFSRSGQRPSPPPSPPSTQHSCSNRGNFSWQKPFHAQAVTFPAIPLKESPPYYGPSTLPANFNGTILRPADTQTYPGQRPAVILQHGRNGRQCSLWYLARALAGSGFVALVYTQPYNGIPDIVGADLDAMVSAIDFLGSPRNPFHSYTNPAVIGVVGHSAGSIATSYVQALPDAHSVKAVVALDNLRHWINGDPGAPGPGCVPPQKYPVTPTVPALGFAMDKPCSLDRQKDGETIKEAGWSWWREHKIPSMELVMRGYRHATFTNHARGSGTSIQLQTISYFVEAWFDRWLNDDHSADQRLLACTVLGQKTSDLLSRDFLSGAYLTDAGALTSRFPLASATGSPCSHPPSRRSWYR